MRLALLISNSDFGGYNDDDKDDDDGDDDDNGNDGDDNMVTQHIPTMTKSHHVVSNDEGGNVSVSKTHHTP